MRLLTKCILFAASALFSLACAAQTAEELEVGYTDSLPTTVPTADAVLSGDTAYTDALYETFYNGLAACSPTIDLSACAFPVSAYDPQEFVEYYAQICHENPELYYVYPNTFGGLTSIGSILYTIKPIYTETDPDVIAATQRDIENAIASLADAANECETDEEKVLAVHDALVLGTAYDVSLERYSAKDALLDHTAVCQGYSDAFYAVMMRLGIPCGFVSSRIMLHVWNAVQIDGKWYHVDCTFDDAMYDNGDIPCACLHDYTLLGNEAFAADGYHYGFPLLADDGNAFDDAPWQGVDSHVTCLAGHMYFADGDRFGIMRYDTLTGKCDKIVDFAANGQKWKTVVNVGGVQRQGTWSSAYSSCEYADGYFYYNSADTVYAVTPDGKETKTVFAAALDPSMSIYGLRIENGTIYAAVGDMTEPRIRMVAEVCALPAAGKRLFAVNDRVCGGNRVIAVASSVKPERDVNLFVFLKDADGRLTDVLICPLTAYGANVTLPSAAEDGTVGLIALDGALCPLTPSGGTAA